MQSLSIVRVVIPRSCQLRADSQLDLGLVFAPACEPLRAGVPGDARAMARAAGPREVGPYFSQPANAELVQPSPE
jgi:hypothetical protein